MPLIDEISAAIADAMRKHDQLRLSALRMLKAALMNREVEKKRSLDDGESRQVVSALVKQRRDSIEQFVGGGRQVHAESKKIRRFRPRLWGQAALGCPVRVPLGKQNPAK